MTLLKKTCFILFLFVATITLGQTKKCNYCKKPIDGKYFVVDGNAYHKNHFICANCINPIEGEYSAKNGKYYDKKCFEKLFSLKCTICNELISGEYLIDDFGLKYHRYHETKLKRCDNCNMLISENTTQGGVEYSDGRSICNLCKNKSINSVGDYERSLKKVIGRLKNYGLRFNESTIKLKIVDLNELRRISENGLSKHIRGFTYTNIRTSGDKKTFSHIIYILNGIPPTYAEATIAHEIMHVWINLNIEHKLSSILEEGSCNYISYTYLKSDYSSDAENIIKQLQNNPDKIYGDGYRKVYDQFRGKDFNLFLNYLKKNRTI